MTWFIIAAIFALLAPLPAIANAHPGAHLNPHLDHGVLIAALIGLVVLAIAIMAVHVAIIRRHNRKVDRLMRTRLSLPPDV